MKKNGSIEDILKDVIKNIGPKGRLTEEEVAFLWGEAAGEKAARHSRPVAFKKAVLTVIVDGSSWLYELTTKKREIIKKLEGKFAGKTIKEIRLRIGEIK